MKTLIIACFATLLLGNCLPIAAQTPDSTKADSLQKPGEAWVWGHVGWFFIAGEAAASLAVDYHCFTGRYAYMGTTSYAPVTPRTEDISFLYGVISRGDWTFASASVGVGYTYGTIPAPDFRTGTAFQTVGLAWELHAAVKAYAIGLGFTLLGNLNLRQSEVRYMLSLHVGYLP